MCRQLAYVGPAVRLSHLFHEAPHSLEHQSYAAREMLEGHVNADGFGVAWWPPSSTGEGAAVQGDGDEPLVYRSERPAWGDAVWRGLAPRFAARATVMNVRNATDASTLGIGSVHPFSDGRWAFTHNGYLTGFREHFLRPMGKRLSDARYRQRVGATDTETLFLLLLDRMDKGVAPADALVAVTLEAAAAAREAGQPSFLNFILGDGKRIWATRHATAPRQPSLYVAHSPKRTPGGSLVASEPLDDDPSWQAVPEGSLVVADGREPPRVTPLGG